MNKKYCVEIELDKTRYMHVGTRVLANLENMNIKIDNMSENEKMIETTMLVLLECLGEDDNTLTLNKLYDIVDECDLSFQEITEKLQEAINLGINKKK